MKYVALQSYLVCPLWKSCMDEEKGRKNHCTFITMCMKKERDEVFLFFFSYLRFFGFLHDRLTGGPLSPGDAWTCRAACRWRLERSTPLRALWIIPITRSFSEYAAHHNIKLKTIRLLCLFPDEGKTTDSCARLSLKCLSSLVAESLWKVRQCRTGQQSPQSWIQSVIASILTLKSGSSTSPNTNAQQFPLLLKFHFIASPISLNELDLFFFLNQKWPKGRGTGSKLLWKNHNQIIHCDCWTNCCTLYVLNVIYDMFPLISLCFFCFFECSLL